MARDIPSLNAIRFFESAARLLSFTKAGEELFVTQGAVSKQIKLLEEQLGCQLFARSGPNLSLTSHGEIFQQTVADALEIIRRGVGNLRRSSTLTLKISVLPSFAFNWLIPRLPHFERQAPSISINLTASYDKTDFSVRTDIDAAIRLGLGNWEDLYSKQLTRDHMFPVCAPHLAKKIQSIDDLKDYSLLVEDKPYDEWVNWFKFSGLPYEAKSFKYYDDLNSQLRAAIIGQGICLCREEMAQEHLRTGELIRLFDVDYISDLHYYFVCPPERIKDNNIKRFHDWLVEMANTN